MSIDPVAFPLTGKRVAGVTRWSTHIQDGLNGDEVRNANWQDSLRRFNVSPGIKTLDDQAMVEAWFLVCQGPLIGFLMRDTKDYKAKHTQTALTNGAARQGVMSALDTTNMRFQLEQLYTNGYRSHRRRITRPQAGTVTLYNASNALIGSGYSIDTVTGIVTTATAYPTPPMWDGNFYVPVRFESDEIPWDVIRYKVESGAGYGEMPEINLIEIRE